jgi:hypothetical protein
MDFDIVVAQRIKRSSYSLPFNQRSLSYEIGGNVQLRRRGQSQMSKCLRTLVGRSDPETGGGEKDAMTAAPVRLK